MDQKCHSDKKRDCGKLLFKGVYTIKPPFNKIEIPTC